MTNLFALFRSLGIAWVVFVATGVTVGAEPKLLDQKLLDDGWISLFDGETMFGWQPSGEAKWEVVDGEIRTDGAKPGWLMTTTEWADYELHVEFKAPANTNSGVFLRTPLKPSDPAKDCYEINIAPPDNPFPTTSVVARQKSNTTLLDKSPALKLSGQNKLEVWDEKWHTFDVFAIGGLFAILCDGNLIQEYYDSIPIQIGHIGLQSREGAVSFRDVRLRPIGMTALFNGKDLRGFSTDRAEKSIFQVTPDGALRLTNGPGQIETAGDFTNFVLQLECKVESEGSNSGIFFRTLRQGHWVGYESQIQNGFKDGDRTKPKDFGTGGIYRRQPARRIVAGDHEWFTNTVVAEGPHMAVWVNGYQVSDWTDTRPPKENAREGRRDAGGAIALQGHDATTDFLFRNIRAVELPR
jgi:hypothetical protein